MPSHIGLCVDCCKLKLHAFLEEIASVQAPRNPSLQKRRQPLSQRRPENGLKSVVQTSQDRMLRFQQTRPVYEKGPVANRDALEEVVKLKALVHIIEGDHGYCEKPQGHRIAEENKATDNIMQNF
ncbi:uncharacterized protein LOC111273079 isoform X2 [Varroa jacobsoni]|uniref:Uncharacterized protein n=1 Tax=Varroa destructor TaxID=109461 RepID=A0A7M7KTD9_VARDE|nr:uncharacterized protein LOC111254191 isoform X2 [Varroa destructor]XP_022710506.1 uncharacterized protein LOC111273079 isoform X2 [Varroa jacobsoni]